MGDDAGNRVTTTYDMIHVTPPQSAPDFIKDRVPWLMQQVGSMWISTTLKHKRYQIYVFSLGDAASSPNSKTAAAIRLQSPVVVQNLLALMKNKSSAEKLMMATLHALWLRVINLSSLLSSVMKEK